MVDKHSAIVSLCPNAEFVLRNNELEWLDTKQTQPTDEAIQSEMDRLQAEYDAQEYARNRASEYPPIGDQLDMIYKDMKNGTTTHAEAVEAVKTKYPKG